MIIDMQYSGNDPIEKFLYDQIKSESGVMTLSIAFLWMLLRIERAILGSKEKKVGK